MNHGHGLKIGDIAALHGLGTRWDETRMEVVKIEHDRVKGTITYIHPQNTHSYKMGGTLRIRHERCKLAEGDPAPLPPLPKRNEFVEIIGSKNHLGLQLQVIAAPSTHHKNATVEGTVVFQGASTYQIGRQACFYLRDLKIIATIRKPRKIFTKEGGWGP